MITDEQDRFLWTSPAEELEQMVEQIGACGAVWLEPWSRDDQLVLGASCGAGVCAPEGLRVALGEPLGRGLCRGEGRGRTWSLHRPLRAHYQRFALPSEEGRPQSAGDVWMRALLYEQERCVGIVFVCFGRDVALPQEQLNRVWAPRLMQALQQRYHARRRKLEDAYIFCDVRGAILAQTRAASAWLAEHPNPSLGSALASRDWYALGAMLTHEPLDGEQPGELIVLRPPPLARLDPLAELSARQREVLALVVRGASNDDIAQALNISANTVKYHVKNIYKMLNVVSRVDLLQVLGVEHVQKLSASTPAPR